MSTLRTKIINANNTRALPASRYQTQHYNSLPASGEKPKGVQPLRYVCVMKKVVYQQAEEIPEDLTPLQDDQPIVESGKPAPAIIWAKGHGAVERIDKKTGAIYHLVEASEGNIKAIEKQQTAKRIAQQDKYQLVRCRTPLRVAQKKPSEVIPQATITSTIPLKDMLNDSFKYTKKNWIPSIQKNYRQFQSCAQDIDSIVDLHARAVVFDLKKHCKLPKFPVWNRDDFGEASA